MLIARKRPSYLRRKRHRTLDRTAHGSRNRRRPHSARDARDQARRTSVCAVDLYDAQDMFKSFAETRLDEVTYLGRQHSIAFEDAMGLIVHAQHEIKALRDVSEATSDDLTYGLEAIKNKIGYLTDQDGGRGQCQHLARPRRPRC